MKSDYKIKLTPPANINSIEDNENLTFEIFIDENKITAATSQKITISNQNWYYLITGLQVLPSNIIKMVIKNLHASTYYLETGFFQIDLMNASSQIYASGETQSLIFRPKPLEVINISLSDPKRNEVSHYTFYINISDN